MSLNRTTALYACLFFHLLIDPVQNSDLAFNDTIFTWIQDYFKFKVKAGVEKAVAEERQADVG